MTKETMTISQLIAEKKAIENKINSIVGDPNFEIVQFYSKNRPFVMARSVEETKKKISSDMQTINDLMIRWNAINKARVKANAETMVEVPTIVNPLDAFAGKEPEKETISIAEAILRKKYFKDNLTKISTRFHRTYYRNIMEKTKLEEDVERKINVEIAQRFPQDANKNWSQETLKKAKDELREEYKVERIDPNNVIANDGVDKFNSYIQSYITSIDTILSIVNAKTEVTFEY